MSLTESPTLTLTPTQVREFSLLPGDRVEAVVRPREPLDDGEGAGIVKLAGEDALLDWPNALDPGEQGTQPSNCC